MTTKLRVLSLGAGVQSSTLALMIEKKEIPMVDAAVFADTQAEGEDTYKFLAWIKTKLSYPIYTVSKGNLTDQLLNSDFPIAPFYSLNIITGKKGLMMRQCTNDYKIQPIIQQIRKLLGIAYRKKVKKNTEVELLMGISYDEIYRMKPNRMPYIKNVFPLIDMRLTRQDCKNWFKKHYNVQPPRSACTYCPYHNDKEWDQMKKNNPKEFQEVVEFDKKIRLNSRKKDEQVYVHRSCKPIGEVDFSKGKDKQLNLFNNVCEGYCGN